MSGHKRVDRATFDEVMVPNYSPLPVVPIRGEGSRVWDQEGREYIDLAGGIAVTSVGHAHPRLVAALTEQAGRLWHVSNVMTNEPALRLAIKLCEATFAERVFFANSGAEANEAGLKLARRFAFDHFGPEKTEIIAFNQAFHGRTLFTVTAGGQAKYSSGFGPLPGDITHLDYNDIDALERQISQRTCAVLMEPVQGEGGVRPADPAFMAAARELCDRHQALLVLDEVQSGNGRSGQLFAYMNYGVTPDILTTAKGMGGGFPIGAMLTTGRIGASLTVGTHGSTYGGNPLGCAVGEAVFDLVSDPRVLAGVRDKHERLVSGLREIGEQFGVFEEVRGLGLLLGCQLTGDWAGRARDFLLAGLEAGLLILMAGPNVLRLAPSLLIGDEAIDEGLRRLRTAVEGLCARQRTAAESTS
jgi:acetylornithine/N-succinyldiaminopimelate aminotransferase